MALEKFKPMMERCSNCLGCRWIPFDKIKSRNLRKTVPVFVIVILIPILLGEDFNWVYR